MVAISSWGMTGSWEHEICSLDRHQINNQIKTNRLGIPYGMGRSYGDVCLNPDGLIWKTTELDRFIHFDIHTGRLKCEAGVLLQDIQRFFIPRGWMLPVTPGTQQITVGGAIANDVHGKNHHVTGSFGNHIHSIQLVRTDASTIECGPNLLPEWFFATIGGLGLTGIIIQSEIQLQRIRGPWVNTEIIPFDHLEEFFRLADESEAGWEYTVSWIDCTSTKGCRGIFMRGNLSDIQETIEMKHRKLSVPFLPPFSLINRFTLKAFNSAYFHLKRQQTNRQIMHYDSFLYPLDHVQHWNRIYGPKGFFQYQSVVPREVGYEAIQAMLNEIARFGEGSFLAVLKTFGARESLGMLSFPRQGVTLALDFPNRGKPTLSLFERLDTIISQAAGRIYPAKDARMPKALFEAGYPRVTEFQNYRDPGISSAMSRRLMGS
jgi:FAD/FMN-containing dehydrogenase